MRVEVLRLEHRRIRDARITTHVCLTARAFGAQKINLSGDKDIKLMENVTDVTKRWGGNFNIEYHAKWDNFIDKWKERGGKIVHLTMYGEPVQKVIKNVQEVSSPLLVIVGGSRVPSKIYKEADFNLSVTSQPHSEVSALAIFLHLLFEGKELELDFEGAEMMIIPSSQGKKVHMVDQDKDSS